MLEEILMTRKKVIQAAINEGIDRKNDLSQESGSARSGSHASRTSISSSALRAHAGGEAKCRGKTMSFNPDLRWH